MSRTFVQAGDEPVRIGHAGEGADDSTAARSRQYWLLLSPREQTALPPENRAAIVCLPLLYPAAIRAMTHATDPRAAGATIVVVPCYNEAKRLNLAAFEAFLARDVDVNLLLVDDGSTDDTPLVLERLRQRQPRRIITLRLGTNVGKAEAVRRGIQLAIRRRATITGYWDADLATPLDAIPRFRALLNERPELLLVMGSRVALLGRRIERRWRRHLLGRIFATAASCVLGLPVYDTQCGAKLFRVTPGVTELFRKPFATRWIFDVEILARLVNAVRFTSPSGEVEAVYEYPLENWHEVQGSRLKPMDFLTAATDLIGIYLGGRKEAARFADRTATTTNDDIPHRKVA